MQAQRLFIILAIQALFSKAETTTDYCKIRTCENGTHTFCRYPIYRKGENCQNTLSTGLSEDEIYTILELHNEFRFRVHYGLETLGRPGPQPSARRMIPVAWDAELAATAQRWAEQCKFEHDTCRNTKRYYVGQNIGQESTTSDISRIKVDWLVRKWYEGVRQFNKDFVENYRDCVSNHPLMPKYSQYTQIVWQDTTFMGCGGVRYFDGRFKNFLLVCNYAPTGNILGQRVYETAMPDANRGNRSI